MVDVLAPPPRLQRLAPPRLSPRPPLRLLARLPLAARHLHLQPWALARPQPPAAGVSFFARRLQHGPPCCKTGCDDDGDGTAAPRGGAGKGVVTPLRRSQLRVHDGGRAVVMVRVGDGGVGVERKKQDKRHFKLNYVKIIPVV